MGFVAALRHPLTASSGSFIFVPQTGFAGIILLLIVSPIPRKKGDISFGRTNCNCAVVPSCNVNSIKVKYLSNLPEINIGANLQIFCRKRMPHSSVASKKLIFRTIPANPSLLPIPKVPDHAVKQQFVLEEKHNSPHSPIYIVGEWGYNHTVELTEYAAVVFHETRW